MNFFSFLVSAFVICTLFVLPSLKLMIQNTTDAFSKNLSKFLSNDNDQIYDLLKLNDAINVKLNNPSEFSKFASDNRPEFVRCLIKFNGVQTELLKDELPVAYLIHEHQHSSKLLSIQGANALVLIDPDNRSAIHKAVLL